MSLTLTLDTLFNTPVFVLNTNHPRLKDVYGAAYDGRSRSWKFPAFYPVHAHVLADLGKVVKGLQLSEEVKQHVQALEEDVTLPEDFSFITSPYQHQVEGLVHLLRNIRAGLFYSPGLGKCKITVDLHRATGDHMLILCPRIMLDTWADEFEKHGNIKDVLILDGHSKSKKLRQINLAIANKPAVVVTTYGIATLYHTDIIKIAYDCIVADESHYMKTPFAKRTKAAQYLASRAYRRVLLSGTPSLGSPFDLYAQLRFLGKYFCPEDWWKFRKEFGVYPDWEINTAVPKMLLGFKNLDVMNSRVNFVCVRKTKEECLDLPDRAFVDVKFGLYAAQKKLYNSLIVDRADPAGTVIRELIDTCAVDHSHGPTLPVHVLTPELITLLGKLDQLSSGFIHKTTKNPFLCDGCPHMPTCMDEGIRSYSPRCKIVSSEPAAIVVASPKNARLDICKDLLETLVQDEINKVIIWANYTAELDNLESMVKELELGYVRVEGGMTRTALTNAVDSFNNDPKIRVYIGQVSTGIGITLNAANYMIYYNLPWSLEHYLQSLDRNYRIGQKDKVTVYRLLAAHTLDETKVVALDQKLNFSTLVTSRAPCVTCPEFAKRCAKYKIDLYDPDCKFDRKMLRAKAKVKLIP